jgi:fatty acyl-CoA reductase
VQDRIVKGMVVFEYYANNQWDFENHNLLNMRSILTKTEANRYIIDGTDMNLLDYFESCIRSARIYILKDMPDTLPAARRHMRV